MGLFKSAQTMMPTSVGAPVAATSDMADVGHFKDPRMGGGGVAGNPYINPNRAAIQDWRAQRPAWEQGGDRGDWRTAMQDWRAARPEFQHGRPLVPGNTGIVPPGMGGSPVPAFAPQPKDFNAGLMASIGKYMPQGWGI